MHLGSVKDILYPVGRGLLPGKDETLNQGTLALDLVEDILSRDSTRWRAGTCPAGL